MKISEKMRLFAATIMQADIDGFTPEKLEKYNEEHLNGILLINNDLRDYCNSRVFWDDAKALFNRIENATRAEILRKNKKPIHAQGVSR